MTPSNWYGREHGRHGGSARGTASGMASRLIAPLGGRASAVLGTVNPVRLICREGRLASLLADLAIKQEEYRQFMGEVGEQDWRWYLNQA